MKKPYLFACIALLAIVAIAALVIVQNSDTKRSQALELALTQLEEALIDGEPARVRPAPGNQIRRLMADEDGRKMLIGLDQEKDRFAFDPATGAWLCVWNGPDGKQVLFVDAGSIDPDAGLTAGMPTQVRITEVRIEKDEAILVGVASSDADDESVVKEVFGLTPGEASTVKIKIAKLVDTDFIQVWKTAEVEDGGFVPNPDREKAATFLRSLTEADSVEKEREVVGAFAAWLREHEYGLEITEADGKHTLACPYFPPVTPWTEHTFLDPEHVKLLPRIEKPVTP